MSLRLDHGAQQPLLPELPFHSPIPPHHPLSDSASNPASASASQQQIVIEVPRSPSPEGDARRYGQDGTQSNQTKDALKQKAKMQYRCGSDSVPSTSSTFYKLTSSIRQNLQEVVSVLKHYPLVPKTRSGAGNDQTVEDHWACRWFGMCETAHYVYSAHPEQVDETYLYDTGDLDRDTPEAWSNDSRVIHDIPEYIFEYAPLVHLFSGEQFWPCDMAEHLEHVTPNLNYTPIYSRTQNLNLTNLDDLNQYNNGRFVYLKSDDNVEERPDWLGGQKNVPNVTEKLYGRPPKHPHADSRIIQERPSQGGRSDAPAVLVVVDKGHGIVDAFWFYFYSYNLGNIVLNVRFGNHIGDWEHSLVRFQHGKPKLMFFSEHFFGEAYTYAAVEKIGKRPVVYSAVGTHAMYATPGLHPYILPLGLLHDETDRGPLWDPLLNMLSYSYAPKTDVLTPSNHNPHAPTNWFFFNGRWGDKLYPMDDSRQYQFAGQHHYVSGPLGPRWKHLGRRKVCQGRYTDSCVVRHWLGGNGLRVWPREDMEGEEELEIGARGLG